jgi:lysophospholipase L1-like esterase
MNSIKWVDASPLDILGQLPNCKNYSRLPVEAQNNVTPVVWEISQNSSGISILFESNTSSINLKWLSNKRSKHHNMTLIAAKGFDLYAFIENKWQFVNSVIPSENLFNVKTIISKMDKENRLYMLNLPLYDIVNSIEIGIDKNAIIEKPTSKIINRKNPVVFYGTSITQGASASRPGLTYVSLLERYYNHEFINLGFSGNGKFEKSVAVHFMRKNPAMVFLDCTPNSADSIIKNNLPELIDYIHSINKNIPIVLIESIYYDNSYFISKNDSSASYQNYISKQNRALRKVYLEKKVLHQNLYYINESEFIGSDHEATIDGIHFNDLGHFRAYENLKVILNTIH